MTEYVLTKPARYNIEQEFGIFSVTRTENDDGPGLDWWPNDTSLIFENVYVGTGDDGKEYLVMQRGAELLTTPAIVLLSPGLLDWLNRRTDTLPTPSIDIDYSPAGYRVDNKTFCTGCTPSTNAPAIRHGEADQEVCCVCHNNIT